MCGRPNPVRYEAEWSAVLSVLASLYAGRCRVVVSAFVLYSGKSKFEKLGIRETAKKSVGLAVFRRGASAVSAIQM